jgi:hypothetical protein
VRRKIFVTLDTVEADGLLDLALKEYRDPRRQAQLLIAEGLRRRGVLPAERSEPAPRPAHNPEEPTVAAP